MSSQGSNSGKLSQMHENLSCSSYQDALRVLEEDTLLTRKLDSLWTLATKCVPKIPQDRLETELLRNLMPHANEILLSIFERAIDIAMNSKQESADTLNELKEYMQMAINLLHVLDSLLDFVVHKNKTNLSDVRSLPVNVSKMLCSTFLHCKESHSFYHVYFDSLDEILTLFKLAQDVHMKLLKVLDAHLTFNYESQEDLLLLKLVLETLVDTGAVLADINVKSMVFNFKGYIALANKHASELSDSFEICQPLRFFSKEIIRNLQLITQQGECKDKNVPQTVKLINFLLKLLLKLCSLFWQCLKTCFDEVWDFLISFYSFFGTQLGFKGVNQGTVDLIKSQLFDCADQLLAQLCNDEDFIQLSNFRDVIHNSRNPFGFLVLFNLVFQKLLLRNERKQIDFPSALQLVFDTIGKSYTEIITDDCVYENLITTASAFILLNNADQHCQVESALYKNLLGANIWSSLIASDIWLLVLSSSSSRRKSETLTAIVGHSKTIMKSNFTHSPNFNILCNFTKRLFRALPEDVRLKFIEKFPCATHMWVWKHIGLGNSIGSIKVNDLLQALMEKMEKFDADRCTCEEFLSMCEYMEAVSTINFEEVYLDVNKLSSLILKLWNFDASNTALIDNNFFKCYIHSLCNLTNSLTWKWTNAQLLQILQQLKLLVNTSTSMKLSALEFLNSLSTKPIENSGEQQMINSVLSDLFVVLFSDGNCVIRQATLETIVAFINSTLHDVVVHSVLKNEKSLQESISNFVQRKVVAGADCGVFLKSVAEKRFVHRCVDWSTSSGPQSKKLKTQSAEAVTVLQRIKSDVNYFCRICERSDLAREDLSDVASIVSQLQKFV